MMYSDVCRLTQYMVHIFMSHIQDIAIYIYIVCIIYNVLMFRHKVGNNRSTSSAHSAIIQEVAMATESPPAHSHSSVMVFYSSYWSKGHCTSKIYDGTTPKMRSIAKW